MEAKEAAKLSKSKWDDKKIAPIISGWIDKVLDACNNGEMSCKIANINKLDNSIYFQLEDFFRTYGYKCIAFSNENETLSIYIYWNKVYE